MLPDLPPIAFRPVTADDYALLERWMLAPHWRQWWGEPETELQYIRDMVEGRDTTRPFIFESIFESGAKPVGYIQYWFVGHHQNEQWLGENLWLRELPEDAIGIDLSIGDEADLSKGLGSAVLGRFAADLHAKGFRNIIIDPDPQNHRAVRAYRKAGFLPIPHLQHRTGDVLLMQYELNEKAA